MHQTLQVRPLTEEDEPAAVALWNRSATHDPVSRPLFQEKVWQDPSYQRGDALLAERDHQPLGLVATAVRDAPDGRRGFIKLLAVAPHARRRGVGALLLHTAERRLADRGATHVRVAESAPNYLTPGVDIRYAEAHNFFQQHEYQVIGQAINMTVGLKGNARIDALADTAPPPGCRLSPVHPANVPALTKLLQQQWPSWQGEVHESLRRRPPCVYLAWAGDRVVGFCAWEGNNIGQGWFGPMGVAPDMQGKGLGKLLLGRVLLAMREMGSTTATIPWAGPTRFYEDTVQATCAREFYRLQKTLSLTQRSGNRWKV